MRGPMDLFMKRPETAIARNKKEKQRQQNVKEACNKEAVRRVHRYIARWFYQAGIPLNPVRVPLLNEELEYTKDLLKGHKEQWEKYGCSIMSDAWTDKRQRSIINFLVNSPAGTMFLKSIDASDYVKMGEKIFELLDGIVEEIGEQSVVQVVTDNGSNYVLAVTRFATSFFSLERLYEEKGNLRRIFTSDEWVRNKLSREAKGREATKIVIRPSFWNHVKYTLKIMGPLVRVLRLVDGEKKPPIGYIYEAMEKAKECIMKTFSNDVSKYSEVFKIVDNRWNCQLHRPLHATGHFLNPELFYDNPRIELDLEVTKGCASGCERNWSIFEHIHTKKRNRLDHERMESLVFIKYNQQLIERYNLKDEVDPIALNNIDECNERLVGEIGTATFRDDDNMDDDADLVHQDDNTLSWNLVFEAMGGHEPTTYTRRQQNKKRKEPATARGGAKGGPSGSKASKKGKGNAVIVEEEEEPEFEDEEDSENEEEQEEEIQFNDTESEDDEGVEGHDNNRVNLDEFDES
ncbi:hypothetical protein AHAS_Ahas11G0044100 [Arachis hypogaea]